MRLHRSIAVAVALVIGGLSVAAGARQDRSSGATASAQARLTLRIGTPKRRLVLGEPLELRTRLANRERRRVSGDFFLGPEFDRLNLDVSVGRRRFEPFFSDAMEIAQLKKRGRTRISIGAGRAVAATRFLGLDARDGSPAFPRPGTYRLRASLVFDRYTRTVRSNVLGITVVRPRGANARAYRYLAGNRLLAFLTPEVVLAAESLNRSRVRAAERFVRVHRRSVYRRYVQRGLAALRRHQRALR